MQTTDLTIEAINKATEWLELSKQYLKYGAAAKSKKMNALFHNPLDKAIVVRILDRAIRSTNTSHVADYITFILKSYGLPKFCNFFEKILLHLFLIFGKIFHFISVPLIKKYIVSSVDHYVLFGDTEQVIKKIRKNNRYGIKTNINRVGELLLGENDAAGRIKRYIEDLQSPYIDCISIKISTIYSQISPLDFDNTIKTLKDRLKVIYKEALTNYYIDDNGQKQSKLVNFDMEEFRDVELTSELLMDTLDEPEFLNLKAGIALQAYLPDSFEIQQRLVTWSKKRMSKGGAPIRIRIVKGANMEMEMLESEERHWDLAPFSQKHYTDANYKRMVDFALKPDNIKAVNLGIASHNLFEVAYAFLLAKQYGTLDKCTFEMLQGMCDHIMRFLIAHEKIKMLAYLPCSEKADFVNSISYLIRRLDENTAPENYLRYINEMHSDNKNWELLKEKFLASFNYIKKLDSTITHRLQDRSKESPISKCASTVGYFTNAADTDFALAANREWLHQSLAQWMPDNNSSAIKIPVVIGEDSPTNKKKRQIIDILNAANGKKNHIIAQYENATKEDAELAIKAARDNFNSWSALSEKERMTILCKVAENIRKRRGDLIGAMVTNTGKTVPEADVEVSEALDFAQYYPYSFLDFKKDNKKISVTSKGVGLVITPWNFPIAIPAGGILASLTAGNTTIFKPSNLSILCGYTLAECFWDAGVPKEVLQFIPSSTSETARCLTSSKEVDFIIFTGGTNTALNILQSNPKVYFAAETGGKNVTIATRFADRDQVIKNVLHSAFSNTGQKCSATSILALEEELYNDEKFIANLKDATLSMIIDYPTNLSAKVGPLVRPPANELEWALTKLDEGEEWIIKPVKKDNTNLLWSPGIKKGVMPGSRSHTTEFFGPVLSVMKIKNLEEGIEIANTTGYGLTAGLESLDHREHKVWKEKVSAGNLYINRGTTGAIVLRQPFGGMNKSAYGCGIKAGGPNYVTQFTNLLEDKTTIIKSSKNTMLPEHSLSNFISNVKTSIKTFPVHTHQDLNLFCSAAINYLNSYLNYFSKEKDYVNVPGQSNITRFRKVKKMCIRIEQYDSIFDILARVFAAKLTCETTEIAVNQQCSEFTYIINNPILAEIIKPHMVHYLTNKKFINIIKDFNRIRYSSKENVPDMIWQEAAKTGIYISCPPVLTEGRFELLQYLMEQSISSNYHRYGHIDHIEHELHKQKDQK